MNWHDSDLNDGGEHFKRRGVTLGRVWPKGNLWQLAISLPLADKRVPYLHPTKADAKETVETTIDKWFAMMDC